MLTLLEIMHVNYNGMKGKEERKGGKNRKENERVMGKGHPIF